MSQHLSTLRKEREIQKLSLKQLIKEPVKNTINLTLGFLFYTRLHHIQSYEYENNSSYNKGNLKFYRRCIEIDCVEPDY